MILALCPQNPHTWFDIIIVVLSIQQCEQVMRTHIREGLNEGRARFEAGVSSPGCFLVDIGE